MKKVIVATLSLSALFTHAAVVKSPSSPLPLLKCAVTRELVLGMSVSIDLTVYTQSMAGRQQPNRSFQINHASMSPDQSVCEVDLTSNEKAIHLRIPKNLSLSNIEGTYNEAPISIRCLDIFSNQAMGHIFVQQYEKELSSCRFANQ